MRFMVIVRATKESEAETGPVSDEKLLREMLEFNEELVQAGVMVAGEGLHPSSRGARVKFATDGSRTVVDGPFAETKELIAGYWHWQVESLEECIEWVRRSPAPFATECEIEIRPLGCGAGAARRETFAERNDAMRFMVIVKATKDSEAGAPPDEKLMAAMGNFNEELVKAGVMLAGEGLHPSSKGARVKFATDGSRTVVDGPFAETKELIAGYWLWQVKSLEECIEWVRRCPAPFATECEIEIRQVYEAEDFGEAFTPELREQEERVRQMAAKLQA